MGLHPGLLIPLSSLLALSDSAAIGRATPGDSAGRARGRTPPDPLSTRSRALWFGLLAPPIAWATHLLLGDGIYELGCASGFSRPAILGLSLDAWAVIQTAAFASVAALAGFLSWRLWSRLRRVAPGGVALERARALALIALGSSLLHLMIILFGLLPPFFIRSCAVSP